MRLSGLAVVGPHIQADSVQQGADLAAAASSHPAKAVGLSEVLVEQCAALPSRLQDLLQRQARRSARLQMLQAASGKLET